MWVGQIPGYRAFGKQRMVRSLRDSSFCRGYAMAGTIELDGERYDRGSTEHLEKIDSLHKSEISKQTEAYVQDLTQRQDLEHR